MTHPHRALLLACAAVGLGFAAPPPATRPAAAPAAAEEAPKPERKPPDESFMRSQRMQRDRAKDSYSHLRDAGVIRLDALVRLTMENGTLKAEAAPAAAPESARYRVEGVEATFVVHRQPAQFQGVGIRSSPTTTVNRFDWGVKDDDTLWSTYFTVNDRFLTVTGRWVKGQVTLTQQAANNLITVGVTEWAGGNPGIRAETVFSARAPTLERLRAEHPEEFRRHVVPLLAKVSDLQWLRPGAADVYAAFPQIQADQKVLQRIRALLPDLDHDAFPVRDAASLQLQALGPAGVLAALRIDPGTLSEEQKGRLGELVAAHRRRSYPGAEAARQDLSFLADCLEYDDAAVRAAAREALEQALGKPLAFDVDSTGAQRTAAVDEVRKLVVKLMPPATQPVDVVP